MFSVHELWDPSFFTLEPYVCCNTYSKILELTKCISSSRLEEMIWSRALASWSWLRGWAAELGRFWEVFSSGWMWKSFHSSSCCFCFQGSGIVLCTEGSLDVLFSAALAKKRDFAQFDPGEWCEGVPAFQKIPLLVTLPSTNPLDCSLPCQTSALVWRSINDQWIQLFVSEMENIFSAYSSYVT